MTRIRPAGAVPVGSPAATLAAEHRALEAAGALTRAGTTLRRRLREVPDVEDDAPWAAYAAAADVAVAHLETDLLLAGARLSAQRAVDPDEVRMAVEAANHFTRQRLEELRVQVRLGQMDLADRAERAVERLEHVARAVRHGSHRTPHTATRSLDEMRRAAGDAIHDAHRALMAVATAASSDDFATEEGDPG